ncbi:MAG: hypothetical protein H7836_15815 [Magnetococcus sp. YQC-3]
MPTDQPSIIYSKPFAAWRLRQVAKIAVTTWGVAVLCLLLAVQFLVGDQGKSYQETLNIYLLGHNNLLPTLLIAGGALASLAGLTTWLFALHGTHLIAGPLARFSHNLQRQIQEGPLPIEQLQDGHFLQVEHLHFAASTRRLQYHYDSISELTDLALAQLQLPDPNANGGLAATLQQLRDLGLLAKWPSHPVGTPPADGVDSRNGEGRAGSDAPHAPPGERLYVDFYIQMRLLIALLILQVTLTGGGIYYLFFRFKEIIEENLYRMHYATQDLSPLLLGEAGRVVAVMLAVNLVCLLLADRVWVRYVRRLLHTFTQLASKVADLDFCQDHDSPDQHAALERMLAWRQKERARLMAIGALSQQLTVTGDCAATQVREPLQPLLQQLRLQLPPYSRRYVGRLEQSKKSGSQEGATP